MNAVCQKTHALSEEDFVAMKRILRYLKGTIDLGLLFTPDSLDFTANSDSDWAANPIDQRSVSGSCVYLGNNPIL